MSTNATACFPMMRAAGVEDGLAARLADPLWLLGRQWQFGEFRGDDAGSITSVQITGVAHHPTWLRPEPDPAVSLPWQRWDAASAPLEAVIEAEAVDAATVRRFGLHAGARLRRALVDAGLGGVAGPLATLAPWPQDLTATSDLDRATMAAVPDPVGLAERIAPWAAAGAADPRPPAELLAALGVGAPESDALGAVLRTWLAWWIARRPVQSSLEDAPNDPAAWDPHRLEHRATLAFASLPDVRLHIDQHPGGALDWYSADVVIADPAELALAPSAPPNLSAPTPVEVTGVPLPATFSGMPAPRFWEFEDATVDYGSVDASPADLARLLLVRFTSVYGNDWLVQSMRLPVGALVRIDGVRVHDSFGMPDELTPFNGRSEGWRAYSLDAPSDRPELSTHHYWSAPALTSTLVSEPVERLTLRRDEVANTAWAIVERAQDDVARPHAIPPDVIPMPPLTDPPRYLVQTPVPTNWFPVVPEQVTLGAIRLRLRALVPTDAAEVPPDPPGQILAGPPGTWWLHEEELERAGLLLDRRVQLGRWHDGRRWRWIGRTREPGVGQASSGLRFDVLADGS